MALWARTRLLLLSLCLCHSWMNWDGVLVLHADLESYTRIICIWTHTILSECWRYWRDCLASGLKPVPVPHLSLLMSWSLEVKERSEYIHSTWSLHRCLCFSCRFTEHWCLTMWWSAEFISDVTPHFSSVFNQGFSWDQCERCRQILFIIYFILIFELKCLYIEHLRWVS